MYKRVLRWLTVGAFCSTAATCGQKGPLELPDEQAVLAVVWNPPTGDHKGRPYECVSRQPGSVCAGTVGDGLVPSRRALWARIDDAAALSWQTVLAVRNRPTGDHKGRPYEHVLRHPASVWAFWRAPDGLRT